VRSHLELPVYWKEFRGYPHSLHPTGSIVSQIRPRPIRVTLLTDHYFTDLPLDTIHPALLPTLLCVPQTNGNSKFNEDWCRQMFK
jgi:hypothetical protein